MTNLCCCRPVFSDFFAPSVAERISSFRRNCLSRWCLQIQVAVFPFIDSALGAQLR